MAFQSISEYDAPPVFQTLVSQGQTSNPVFAFKMAENGSELSIGGLDPNVYVGDPTYASVTVKAHWQIAFSSIIVGGHIIADLPAAIIDSVSRLDSFIFLANVS
jgi:cathepsin D